MTSAPSEEDLHCQKCKLYEVARSSFLKPSYVLNKKRQRGIPTEHPEKGWIVVLTGYPSAQADEVGDYWADNDARLVFQVSQEHNLMEHILAVPLTLCRPNDPESNDTRRTKRLTPTQQHHCFKYHTLKWLEDIPIRFVLGVGQTAGACLFRSYDLLTLTKSQLFWKDKIPAAVVEAYSDVSYDKQRTANLKKSLMATFHRISTGERMSVPKKDQDVSYTIATSADQVREWFSRADKKKVTTWDCETNSLHVYKSGFKIGLFSVANRACPDVLLIPTVDYPDLTTRCGSASKAIQASQEMLDVFCEIFLEDDTWLKVGHNVKYDENAVWMYMKRKVRGFLMDTLFMKFILDPDNKGFGGLDDLVKKHCPTMPHYWLDLMAWMADKEHKGCTYLDIPPEILYPYAAWDAEATLQVYEAELKALEEMKGGYFVYVQEGKPIRKSVKPIDYCFHVRKIHHLMCAHMERVGQPVDVSLASHVAKHYTDVNAELEAALRKDPKVIEFESASPDDTDTEGRGPRLPDFLSKKDQKLWKLGGETHINWGSGNQLKGFMLNFMKLPVIKKTEIGAPCLDESVLTAYAYRPELDRNGSSAVAQKLLTWREGQTFVKSYIKPISSGKALHSDGIVHAGWNGASIATGRLSANNPNVTGLPRTGPVKKLYTAHDPIRGWLITRDYSNIEVRILAAVTRDSNLLRIFREGGDPHFYTQQYFFKDAANKKDKDQRSICKQCLFGRLYGQEDHGLYELMTKNGIKNPETGQPITLEECAAFNAKIDELYPAVAKWVLISHQFGARHRWIGSSYGFTRLLPALEHFDGLDNRAMPWQQRSAIMKDLRRSQNAPIQSTAADTTVMAAWKTQQMYEERGLKTVVSSIVHDDIWSSAPCSEEVPEAVSIKAWVMNNPQVWMPELIPNYDCGWLDVPLIGETDIGVNAIDAVKVKYEPQPGSSDPLLVDFNGEQVNFLENQQAIRQQLMAQRLQFTAEK